MADVHVGDTLLTLRCVCTADLTTITEQVIRFFDPDGKPGEFPGTIPSPATDGYIEYEVLNETDLYKHGVWRFYADVTNAAGKHTYSDTHYLTIKEPGK